MMDEIAKEIQKQNLGVQLTNSQKKVGCLLWVDDVVLISNDEKELQKMLDITDEIAKRYHLEFGKEKSKTMEISNKRIKQKHKFKLGNMVLDQTESYKYLGEVINTKNNLENQIKEIRAKTEAAFQTILILAENEEFRNIEMDCIWKLLETCITPIILYGSETWNLNKSQVKELNRIYDNLIKRILKTPPTTPREALYMETGLMDIETMVKKRKIGMKCRLQETISNLMAEVLSTNLRKGWKTDVEQIMEQLEIQENELHGSKYMNKKTITNKAQKFFQKKIETDGAAKSKIKHLTENSNWEPGKRREYLNKLTRNQSSTIFKARTRMLMVKSNYKTKYQNNLFCRACGKEEETQNHVLEECQNLHQTNGTKVTINDIFSQDYIIQKYAAMQIENTLKKLETDQH